MKGDLLLNAKREAVNELFGELITASTTVDNLVVTSDEIRSQSIGLIRLQGNATYANGTNLAEVCVTIAAYVSEQDRAQFLPQTVNKRQYITEPDLSVREVQTKAEEAVRVQALVDYDLRLGNYAPQTILPLLRQVEYSESNFLPGTETYCVTVAGSLIPIEVRSFLSWGASKWWAVRVRR